MSRTTATTRRFRQLIEEHHLWTRDHPHFVELQSIWDNFDIGLKKDHLPTLNLIRVSLGLEKIKLPLPAKGAVPTRNRHLYVD